MRMKILSSTALLPDGWCDNVLVSTDDAGNIASVTRDAADNVADVRVGALLPGVGNLHSHAFQRAMAGLTEVAGPARDSFWTWRRLMYQFVARLTPEDVEAIAAQLYVEMLRHGYTGVAEFHYLRNDVDGGRSLAENPEQIDPVHTRHADVAEHNIRGKGREPTERVFRAVGGLHLDPEVAERLAERAQNGGVVIDQQNASGHSNPVVDRSTGPRVGATVVPSTWRGLQVSVK